MMTQDVLIYSLTATSAGCAAALAYPPLLKLMDRAAGGLGTFQQAQVERTVQALDEMFMEVTSRRLQLACGLGPLVLGLLAGMIANNLWLGLGVAAAGFVMGNLWVSQIRAARRRQFRAQLVDALFVFSSSLRAGLSLTQAFEVVQSEMSPPASQEFGLMLRAHRLGVPLEEALHGMQQRMASEELQLFITAIEVTRETGGDVTGIVTQLITTIREKRKLYDKVSTLTLQGRLQAYIMSFLPIGFALAIRGFNDAYFRPLVEEPVGRMIITIAAALWIVGMILLFRVSKIEV
jgi:tight adherence protein B